VGSRVWGWPVASGPPIIISPNPRITLPPPLPRTLNPYRSQGDLFELASSYHVLDHQRLRENLADFNEKHFRVFSESFRWTGYMSRPGKSPPRTSALSSGFSLLQNHNREQSLAGGQPVHPNTTASELRGNNLKNDSRTLT